MGLYAPQKRRPLYVVCEAALILRISHSMEGLIISSFRWNYLTMYSRLQDTTPFPTGLIGFKTMATGVAHRNVFLAF
ncbi:hypothetical protein X474_27635 [Dethiosulfatarculus sandiegensis]|uniref:Uncharacterized protein n=1 Tax=Dethiosulfatarculus sandiegensis TaxID=1429043 RepID=A0A0D2IXK3_9BACT|nr:hypothetical protein X474_27635 [Dethiosulfatarculus sandiegensis]